MLEKSSRRVAFLPVAQGAVLCVAVSLCLSLALGGHGAFAKDDTVDRQVTKVAEDNKGAKEQTKTKVRYKKTKRVDFSKLTVEGKLRRPEASLITAGEVVTDSGILRLRTSFLDKYTAFCGEEIQ
jgi:hypothetical protein